MMTSTVALVFQRDLTDFFVALTATLIFSVYYVIDLQVTVGQEVDKFITSGVVEENKIEI